MTKIRVCSSSEYWDIEADLCRLHTVPEEFEGIDEEWAIAKARFKERIGDEFGEGPPLGHYEFPDWHNNIRLLWIYLYTEGLYTPRLIEALAYALEPFDDAWFAECECYTDAVPDTTKNQHQDIGMVMYHKQLLLVDDNECWANYLSKLDGA